MSSIYQDLKYTYNKPNNTYIKLIIINVGFFIFINLAHLFLFLGNSEKVYHDFFIKMFTMPADATDFIYRPWTLISYAFSHEGLFHIFFNMLVLYWFGMLLTEYLGSKKLLSIYVLGGILGGIFYIVFYNILPVLQPRVASSELIGASGAVMAVVLATATLLPDYTFNLLLVGPVKLKYIALFYVLMSVLFFVGNPGGNLAHLGGALIGYLFIVQLRKGNDIGKWLNNFLDGISNLFKKKRKVKIVYKKTQSKKAKVTTTAQGQKREDSLMEEDEYIPNQAEIDAILDKISDSGYESLSKEEKQKLFKASKK